MVRVVDIQQRHAGAFIMDICYIKCPTDVLVMIAVQ